MPNAGSLRRGAAAALAIALGLALSACLLSPGKFTSALDIRKDGRFSFSYTGEIHLLALSKLAEMGNAGASETFKPETCKVEDSDAERKCTPREIAEQKRIWQETRKEAEDKRKRDGESMKAMLGGIDPSDPRAAEELAERLRRQAGWRRVVYKGDGLFEVEFAIAGRLDHDFAFPTIERFPMANAFVTVSRRADGSLRIDGPGFGPAAGGDPMRGMMQAMALSGAKAGDGGKMPNLPVADGRLSITTDGAVVANNTEEGPQLDIGGHRLVWTVNGRNLTTAPAPMALIRLAQ
jgi:hypothetical protein